MQVEALAQGRNLVRHVLGPLLGRESPALGVEIKQSVLLYHDRHALGLVPQGVDALFLPGQLHRVGSIRHQPHLLNLHAQVSLVQTSDGQLLADSIQGYRIRIGFHSGNGGQAVRTQNIKHFVHDLGRHADRRQAEQTKAEKTELLHVSICLRLRGSNLRKVSDIAMQIPAVNHSPIIIYRLSFTINSYLCTVKLKL